MWLGCRTIGKQPLGRGAEARSSFCRVPEVCLSIRGGEIGWPLTRAELLPDRGEVDPDPFALDLSVGGELEHVEQPEACRAAHAVAKAPMAVDDLTRPERLVDQEVIAVEAHDRRDALPPDRREQHLVVGPQLRQDREWPGLVHEVLVDWPRR